MAQIPQKISAKIITKNNLSTHVIFIQLKPDKPTSFDPGQYCSWLIDKHRRPLSFASLPSDTTLDFIVGTKANGICSNYVNKIQVGDTINFLSPYGRFTLADTKKPSLFIATGTGIAPIRSQIKSILKNKQKIHLIYGNQNENNLILHDELSQLAKQPINFTYTPTLSNPTKKWSGNRGLVTTITPQLIKNLIDYEIYICGQPVMVSDMKIILEKNHVPLNQIHTEQFS